MNNEKEKYQNILTQLHELNRNIVLNENEKVEQLEQKIDNLSSVFEKSSANTSNKKFEKYYLSLIIISLINTFILIFIIFNINNKEEGDLVKKTPPIEIKKPTLESTDIQNIENNDSEENNNTSDDILSFNEKSIVVFEQDEEFVEMKPIIRKGTKYTCKENPNTYKIPYTVEIKGKLYSNRFEFILQENSTTKECTIEKENM